ncbi:Bud site selection protein 6 [Coniosporium tulheliwenetii]|uniref:Bud site selection protein 6 n=1 Tax=Coniosporium tulheliwenetii TaxID=3383036 RepID=A0ACC2Z4E4_9PEZI|nr:Bud site selection protein 6 [Cladosporium sp. JES 115]
MTLAGEEPGARSSSASGRSSQSRRHQTPQQQLSQIEKSVTHLLVATKQLLETLTLWSRGQSTEGEVSDVYVRLGYEFNIASRAFNAIGVDTQDLGPVPDLLRGILEETLSQEASQASLDRFLPRIRDIIINLLHGLKRKQQRLRQRTGRDGMGSNGSIPRQGSLSSNHGADSEDGPVRQSSIRPPGQRSGSAEMNGPDLPPRTSSATGRHSPNKYESPPPNARVHRNASTSRETLNASDTSSMSSNTMQNIPVISPYPLAETMPSQPTVEQPQPPEPPPYVDFPPPPPPPKQQDALAQLQRGELSDSKPRPRRAESMNAVRIRESLLHSRQKSYNRFAPESSPTRNNNVPKRISEESSSPAPSTKAPSEPAPEDSATAKNAEEKLDLRQDHVKPARKDDPSIGVAISGPDDNIASNEPQDQSDTASLKPRPSALPARHGSRTAKTPSPSPPQSQQFIPEDSPQPGKELTLFLQYKSQIKKFVLADGYNELSIARLQLAFIEKFAWNTHNNGVDLPEIYVQDPVSGARYELEDLGDVKDRSVLALNVEPLDEVKRHIDDGLGGLRRVVEGIKTAVEEQGSALQRVSERQAEAAKEIASIAAAPPAPPPPPQPRPQRPQRVPPAPLSPNPQPPNSPKSSPSAATWPSCAKPTPTSPPPSTPPCRPSAPKPQPSRPLPPPPPPRPHRRPRLRRKGKKSLQDDSEKIVARVDDLQDLVEDLRKDVVTRGVRPLPRMLESVGKDLSTATLQLKRMQEFLRKEKPVWTKIWEQELQLVCDDREVLTMQEELAADLERDLEEASETFKLVEEATRQQNLAASTSSGPGGTGPVGQGGLRSASGRNVNALAADRAIDPRQAKDGVLGEVRALQPNHEGRLEAIERAERARLRELESRRGGEFQKELGNFVEEGKLKKTGASKRRREDGGKTGEGGEAAEGKGVEGGAGEAQVTAEGQALANGEPDRALETPADTRAEDGATTPSEEFVEAKEDPNPSPPGEPQQQQQQQQQLTAENNANNADDAGDGPRSSWLSGFLGR